MKIYRNVILTIRKSVVIFFCTFCALPCCSYTQQLVISEIMFNPNGNENAREYVELLNLSDEVMSLEGFLIGDGTGFDAIKPAVGESWTVPPGAFGVILDPDYFTADEPYNIPAGTPLFTVNDKAIGNRGLSNSTAEPVYLISAHGDTVSMVYYSLDCPPGHSWERIIPSGSDSIDNFKPSKEEDGTPGQKNSVTPEPQNPALDEGSIRFSPSRPQMGDELEIILTYRNGGLEAVSNVTVNVWLLPDFQAGFAVFPETVAPGEISGEVSLSIDNVPGGRLAFTAAVVTDGITPSAEDDTITVTLDVSVPEATVILNEVMAAPQNGRPEWVEIFNSAGTPADLYHWNIADSKGTPVGRVSEHLFVPENGYAVISSGALTYDIPANSPVTIVDNFPALNNDGDKIVLIDFADTPVDSMWYDVAPSGNSMELISPSMRGEAYGWDVCVDQSGATPGRMNSIHYSQVPEEGGKKSESIILKVNPNPFPDVVTISYQLPFQLARIRLYVYDRRGRVVARIRDIDESGSEWTGTWNGRIKGTRLPAGPYILNLEALDKRTGKVYTERETIVIARKL